MTLILDAAILQVQNATDKFIKEVDSLLSEKELEMKSAL